MQNLGENVEILTAIFTEIDEKLDFLEIFTVNSLEMT